jgi:hypothetical protein
MRKHRGPLQPISPLLDSIFRDLGVSERMKLDTLCRRWPEIFTGPLASHTAPVDMKEGILVIAVDSPTWLQHLKFMKKDILEKLKGHGVKDLKLKHGTVHRDREGVKPGGSPDEPLYRELTAGETEGINRAVTEIEDDELKDIVRSVLEKSVGRKRV